MQQRDRYRGQKKEVTRGHFKARESDTEGGATKEEIRPRKKRARSKQRVRVRVDRGRKGALISSFLHAALFKDGSRVARMRRRRSRDP